jgi:23S rRNA (uracil1939-C5)-methyltransferase
MTTAPSPPQPLSLEGPLIVPRGPKRGDLFTVRISHVNDKGEGVSKLDLLVGPGQQALSYPVVARDALAGETVEVAVTSRYRRVLSTRVQHRLADAENRVVPHCQHFGDPTDKGRGCGGCSLQHLSLQGQREEKAARVRRLLQSAGLSDDVVQPTLEASAAWHYRNKMEFSFGNDGDRAFSLGLHPAGYRYETLSLAACHLMSPFTSALLPRVSHWAQDNGLLAFDPRHNVGLLRNLVVREGQRTGERMLVLHTELRGGPPDGFGASFVTAMHEIAGQLDGKIDSVHWLQRDAERGRKTTWLAQHLDGKPQLQERLVLPGGRELVFEIGPQAFFQPSTLGAEVIYGEVIRQSGLQHNAAATVVDLYCGTGTIALCLAPWAERVVGIELNTEAVANGRLNAAANAVSNVQLHCGDAGAVLASLALDKDGVDVVVVDPPRAGLNAAAIHQIAQLQPDRVVYVACKPHSLARDCAALAQHGYELTVVQPIDQFPQTGHIECVATLVLRAEKPVNLVA